jgi:hypothetical protein
MAKVISPLFSFEASGKIANSMVFFTWKGRNVVRKWTIPTNPMTDHQGSIRLKLLSCAKGLKAALLTAGFVTGVKDLTPAGQIWNAYLIKIIMDQFLKGDTSYTSLQSAYTHATAVGQWVASATGLDMIDEWLTYAPIATIASGQQLFQQAKAAAYIEHPNIPVGSPDTWLTANVVAFAGLYTLAAS